MPEETTPARPRRTVAQQLRTLLATEGYRPRRAADEEDPSSVHFKVEGRSYVVRTLEADPDFVAVCTGYALDDATKDEPTLLRAALEVQNEMKVVKIYLPRSLEWVEFQLELFLDGRALSASLLERCLGALRATSSKFFKSVTPEEKPQACA